MSRDAGASRSLLLGGIGAFVLFAIMVASAFERGMESGRGTRAGTSFRADATGTLAARLLLERLGYDVGSRRGTRLPGGIGNVLVRLEGVHDPDAVGQGVEAALGGVLGGGEPENELIAKWERLRAWVERGNGLLLCASRVPNGDDWPWVDEMRRHEPVGEEGLVAFFAERGLPFNEHHVGTIVSFLGDVRRPLMSDRFTIRSDDNDEVLASAATSNDTYEPVIVQRAMGEGTLILVSDPYFLANVRLGSQGDNAAWLAVMVDRLHGVGDNGGGDVVFDDRAVGQSASRGVLSLLIERGLGPALGAGFVLVLIVWWRFGPSDAPDRRVRDDPVYAPESFAELRAGLYSHCLRADDVRRTVDAEVVRRISRGDALSYERALDLLAARDPDGARRIRDAVDALPDHPEVTVRRYPRLWADGVAAVWQALETVRHGRERTSTGG